MSLQDRRVVSAVQEAIAGGVDLVLGVLPEPVRSGAELVRGQVERTLGGWVLGLLDRLVKTGVVVVLAKPGATMDVVIREGQTPRKPGHGEDV